MENPHHTPERAELGCASVAPEETPVRALPNAWVTLSCDDVAMPDVAFALQPLPEPPAQVIYLAGPVPRDNGAGAWHPEAIDELARAGFLGTIAVPRLPPDAAPDAASQVRWECAAMSRADALLFWVPRALWSLPGLTTDLEWGIWHDSGKAVLGAPPDAPRMRYLRFYAELAGAPQANSLRDAARAATAIAASRVQAASPEVRDR